MTGNEKINENEHIFRNSQLVSDNFTEEGLTETYVETLAMFEEIRQYRKIGTVEECKEAVKKQEMMTLRYEEVAFIGKSLKIEVRCPQCGAVLGVEIDDKPIIPKEIRYCFNCGQRLWQRK